MIWCIIITIILIINVVVNLVKYTHEYNCPIDDLIGNMLFSIIIGAFLLGITLSGVTISMGNEPRAIDVYRGKTELEIHSINNIPQDTVVVWKGGKQ